MNNFNILERGLKAKNKVLVNVTESFLDFSMYYIFISDFYMIFDGRSKKEEIYHTIIRKLFMVLRLLL